MSRPKKAAAPVCGAKRRQCSACKHRYPKAERELTACPECGASRLCQNKVKGEGVRCRFHAGRVPRGIAHPNFRHGRYSQDLPASLLPTYEEARLDADLLSLRDEIALLRARIRSLVQRLGGRNPDDAGTLRSWAAAREGFARLQYAIEAGQAEAVLESLAALRNVFAMGTPDDILWDDLHEAQEQLRRLVESERKRMVELGQMISVQALLIMLARVETAIKTHVTDPTALTALSREFAELMVEQTRGRVDSAVPELPQDIPG